MIQSLQQLHWSAAAMTMYEWFPATTALRWMRSLCGFHEQDSSFLKTTTAEQLMQQILGPGILFFP